MSVTSTADPISRRGLISRAGPVAAIGGLAGLAAATVASSPVSADTSGRIVPVDPFRLVDSRVQEPDKYGDGALDGIAVPDLADYQAVLLNITVTETEGAGFIRIGREPEAVPSTSNINWTTAGQTIANFAVIFTAGGPGITLQMVGGRAHVILDVLGYVT